MDFSVLLAQIGWAVPVTTTVVVIAVIATVRRDTGSWWKLVLAGAVALVLGQCVAVVGAVVIYSMPYSSARIASFLAAGGGILLQVIGLALLGAGAIVGRRAPKEVR